MGINKHLYTNNYNSFDEWFTLITKHEQVYPQFRIPHNEWLEDYINGIRNKSIDEIKELLRCLLKPINRKLDVSDYEFYIFLKESKIPGMKERAEYMYLDEKIRRIESGYYAWEGITWILELLPHSPYQAITALEGYAYAQSGLPDDRIIGIKQCIDIIYERFIYLDKPNRNLLKLKPVEFEWLIQELYSRMGYDTEWTSATRDGGKDIIASITRPDGKEYIYIECKLYKTTKLNQEQVKAFAYTMNEDKINRGVIFCTGYSSDALRNLDKRITILTYENICTLLNAHLGGNWNERLDKIIDFKRKQHAKG